MLKKAIYKSLLLLAVLALVNVIYVFTIYPSDLKNISSCAYQCKNLPEGVDMVYFGESSNFTVDGNDSTQLYISELIQFYAPQYKVVTIDTPAVHAGIYKYWIKEIKLNLPKAIIVTMNLRSFDGAWIHSKLETALIRSVRLLNNKPKIVNRFLLSLKNAEDLSVAERDSLLQKEWRTNKLKFPYQFKYNTVREWDNAMANGGWLKPDGSWDMDKITLAAHYIKAYAFNIDEKNPRIRDFDEIAAWGKENGVQIYFNILAENVAKADSLVGKDLVFLMRNNRDYLVNRYSKMGVVVVDNLESAGINDFLDKNWTTEHYNYRGRIAIAKKVVSQLKIK
ncbi:MAG: hypothetical protein JNM96_05160 [Bacteroidia bacterium]|nr:hypothetical protein [Bacteroidia bacterium]